MVYECHTFSHTADVGLEATADTLAELYQALAEGLAEFICPRASVAAGETARTVKVTAEDREVLAIDFLSRVLHVIQGQRFMVAAVRVTAAGETFVDADLLGEPYDPARHELHVEVKAVTYHMLAVEPREGRWYGRVVLDL